MLKITDDNYNYYKEVYAILWQSIARFNELDPNAEYSPLIILNNWERKSKSLAKRGLKAGLIDAIGMSIDLPIDMKKNINSELTANGFLGFNQLISIVRDTLQKVLKRGKIKNVDEYYILKELLDDPTSGILEGERKQLAGIFGTFEIDYVKKKRG